MSTYEELQIILATALLIVAILAYTHKKIAVLFFGENDSYFILILLFHPKGKLFGQTPLIRVKLLSFPATA